HIVGKNIVVEGNVFVPTPDGAIFADNAVINIENEDIEATGDIRFVRWYHTSGSVTPERLAELERSENVKVSVTGVSGDLWGERQIAVKADGIGDSLQAERMVGNIKSGYFAFENVRLKFNTFVCRAKLCERRPDGVMTIKDASVSACSYLESDNSHYSVTCNEATLTPHYTGFYGVDEIDTDLGDHTILLTNGFWRIYGMPVLWLPVFYKPKDESPGLFSVTGGKSSDWGFYVLMSKRYTLLDYPYSAIRLHGDYYQKRGFGYGLDASFVTEESVTEAFVYAMYDRHPEHRYDYNKYRINVPNYRFDMRVANVTHITPRLDFRGAFEYASDPYFTRDFFSTRYNADPQPATYAALEQQFDHLTASLYLRARVNSYDTTSESLPGFRLDVQRQEIFDTNIYYQGDFSTGYHKMNWIDFDRELAFNIGSELKDYEAFRLDTTHFLYYPLRFDWLTVVPRAGVKMTVYSNSSKTPVSSEDLVKMFLASQRQNLVPLFFNNYDNDGGSLVRFAGELGLEASTKFYNSWEDVKNTWLRVDGLRHIVQPFMNYTYIPEPTQDRENIYYFDDIDRLTKQNFVRLGLNNRLQTRSGSGISDIMSMTNYIDMYMDSAEGENNLGNFCTILSAKPFAGLTLSTLFDIDAGGNNNEEAEIMRAGRNVGHPGLDLKWLNRWTLNMTYSPAEDWSFSLGYTYRRPYSARSAYSMGSTFTQISAGRYFDRIYTAQTQQIEFGFKFPITPDRRTFGSYNIAYDFYDGYITSQSVSIRRLFHCFEVVAAFSLSRDTAADSDGGGLWGNYEQSFSISVYLTNLQGPMSTTQNTVLRGANKVASSQTQNGKGWF
ncbi:MAG: putative LPS assembly protein LptD, partial [Victivallaceae bacterium]|nr:putative LPS assembly protein LptD [Victivallaceae bacterium]